MNGIVTRDQLVEQIKGSTARGFYVQLFSRTYMRTPKSELIRHLSTVEHERYVGYVMYVSPLEN